MAETPTVWSAYRTVLASRISAQLAYRTSFGFDTLTSFGVGLAEFGEMYAIFHNVKVLGGLDFRAAAFVFALANLGFALADLVVGNLDTMPDYIRRGTLDVMLVRPLSALGQLVSVDLTLRRVGRVAFGVLLMAVTLAGLPVVWTPARVALLLLAPLTGGVLFGALFVIAGAVQFWLIEGGEFTAAFTYGAEYVAGYPGSIFPWPLRVFFSFVVPGTLAAYLPALAILGRPGPPGLPAGLSWWLPLLAALFAGLAGLAWRSGLRHYVGAGG